ncbi:hypothetical protein D3C86_1558540 [compost metagenome]
MIVGFGAHLLEAIGLIVGVEKDDIGLNAQLAQSGDAGVQTLEIGWVKASEVPVAIARSRLRVREDRFIGRDGRIGEDQQTQLVERRGAEGLQRLTAFRFGLMGPAVTGRADLAE